jgi:hypothetical protein
MWKKILLAGVVGLAAVVAVLAIVVALQPADFRVVRATVIDAEPAAVFEHVNDFHNWEAWSPWAKLDPEAKYSFDGPTSGRAPSTAGRETTKSAKGA